MRIRLDLRETDDWVPVRLSGVHADLLAASEIVAIRPDGKGRWLVQASGAVGAAVIGEPDGVSVDVRIEPKVPIGRLLFMLGYARSPRAWRDDVIDTPEATDIPTGVAESVVRLTDTALRQGLLQGYRTVEEAALTVRGRVRHKQQLSRRFGMALPVEITYDDYSPDIPENQILRTALGRMLAVPGVPNATRHQLTRLRHRFGEVSELHGGQRPPSWQPSRLNTRYQPALRLAELVLRSTSFDLGRGAVPATGFLISMPKVFEDFVTTALREALEMQFGGRGVTQDSKWYLDAGRTVALRPDLVWYPVATGRPALVLDAKYKAEKYSGFPNPDIYQMLAYCSAMRLPSGHLVYAKGNEPRQSYLLPHTGLGGSGVSVTAHTLDLEASPADLLLQVDALAEEMTRDDLTHGAEVARLTL